jgi:2-keto-3-deoxy-L-rhamnonate aldolase RhmA
MEDDCHGIYKTARDAVQAGKKLGIWDLHRKAAQLIAQRGLEAEKVGNDDGFIAYNQAAVMLYTCMRELEAIYDLPAETAQPVGE